VLCNTIYKIFTKVVENLVKKILLDIIFDEKIGFILEKSIFDGVIIVQEAIHSIPKVRKQSMLIKFDIKKAFENVN
jgi:hypothetical protein